MDATFYGSSNDTISDRVRLRWSEISPICPDLQIEQTSVVNTVYYRFIDGVVDTGEQFIAGVVDTDDKHSFVNISANFRKNLNGLNGILRDPRKKNLQLKISCQTPCKRYNMQWLWRSLQKLKLMGRNVLFIYNHELRHTHELLHATVHCRHFECLTS